MVAFDWQKTLQPPAEPIVLEKYVLAFWYLYFPPPPIVWVKSIITLYLTFLGKRIYELFRNQTQNSVMRNNHSIFQTKCHKISKDKGYDKQKTKISSKTKKSISQRWNATGLKVSKRKRNIAAYHQYKALDKPWLMFLEETIKNSEIKKEKCGAAERRCQSFCLGGLIQRCLHTALSPLRTYSSRIFILRDTPLLQSCIFLEEAEKKPDLQLRFKKDKDV